MKDEKGKRRVILPPPYSMGYPIVSDPLGMYTGVLDDPEEKPVQDADDL